LANCSPRSGFILNSAFFSRINFQEVSGSVYAWRGPWHQTPSFLSVMNRFPALDVAIQAQILNLLQELQEELGLTYLFISHDVGVVQHICDEIAVMYLGRIVEQADRRSLFQHILHPYTQALMAAVPKVDLDAERSTERLRGDVPSPIDPPPGCHFHTRCPHAELQCRQQVPELREVLPNHRVACHIAEHDGLHHRSSIHLVSS
jgi:oligopeptide/dipeptide ABC transporter ATP-binding protein